MQKKKTSEKEMAAKDASANLLVLPAIIDMNAALPLTKNITQMLQRDSQITIDASKVERITTSGIQVLIATHRELESTQGSLKLQKPSTVFCQAFDILGLTHLYQLWSKS